MLCRIWVWCQYNSVIALLFEKNPASYIIKITIIYYIAWHVLCMIFIYQGRPQDLGGGGPRIFFFRFVNLHVAKRHAAHGEAMRIARGFGGMLPQENFLKRCNLVRFRVYFDQILSLFFSKKCHFLSKK